jgi:hypothetical protein
MRIRFLAVVVCLLALAACSGGNDATEQPQAIRAETTAATTTTVAPTTTKPTGLGVTQNYRYEEPGYEGGVSAGKVTVFRYRDASVLPSYLESELAKESKRSVAIEVRVCITELPPGIDGSVSWAPWSLGDDQGASYEAWISYSDDVTVQPPYPDGKTTPVGTCRRGWVPFEVPRNWKPDFVEYNTGEGNILKWPISK